MPSPATADTPARDPAQALGQSLLSAVGAVPPSRLHRSAQPDIDGQAAARRACAKAGLAAGTLALPLGPLGWLTVLPEMVSVWRIQAQLVADIAALHGHPPPSQEALVLCLFQHNSGRLLRDLVVTAGERSLVRAVPAPVLRLVATQLGARLAKRVAGKSLARWLPVAGALGLAALAVWDTRQVARTAHTLFSQAALPGPAPGP